MPLHPLESNQGWKFSDWPNATIPRVAAGAYTIWAGTKLVYAGMAGRGHTADTLIARAGGSGKVTGLYSRLSSHAAGRRSGNQFCVYVGDRLVMPELTRTQIQQIAAGKLSLDALIRRYIHDYLQYRFYITTSAQDAVSLEKMARAGGLTSGRPLLNPL